MPALVAEPELVPEPELVAEPELVTELVAEPASATMREKKAGGGKQGEEMCHDHSQAHPRNILFLEKWSNVRYAQEKTQGCIGQGGRGKNNEVEMWLRHRTSTQKQNAP